MLHFFHTQHLLHGPPHMLPIVLNCEWDLNGQALLLERCSYRLPQVGLGPAQSLSNLLIEGEGHFFGTQRVFCEILGGTQFFLLPPPSPKIDKVGGKSCH